MKVLLVQPPLEDFYTTPIRLYPLGLLYAAAVFERAGCAVEILDCLSPLRKTQIPVPPDFAYMKPFMDNPYFFNGYYRFGMKEEQIVQRIRDFAPDIIGVSSQFTAYYQSVEELALLIQRNFQAPVFIGGTMPPLFLSRYEKERPR